MFKASQFYQHSLKANKTKNACFTKFVVSYRAACELYTKTSIIKSVNTNLMIDNLASKSITRSVITDLVIRKSLEEILLNQDIPRAVISRDNLNTIIDWKENAL